MSYTQSAIRITSELSGASIKPEFEAEPVRFNFGWVLVWCALSHIIAGMVL